MIESLKNMITSKKFIAACLGVFAMLVQAVLKGIGLEIGDDKIAYFIGLLATYILGQGIADFNKSAAAAATPLEQLGVEGNDKLLARKTRR